MQKIEIVGSAAATSIQNIGTELFARHTFPDPRYDYIASNIGESANPAPLKQQAMSVLQLLKGIWCHQMNARFRRKTRVLNRAAKLRIFPRRNLRKPTLYSLNGETNSSSNHSGTEAAGKPVFE